MWEQNTSRLIWNLTTSTIRFIFWDHRKNHVTVPWKPAWDKFNRYGRLVPSAPTKTSKRFQGNSQKEFFTKTLARYLFRWFDRVSDKVNRDFVYVVWACVPLRKTLSFTLLTLPICRSGRYRTSINLLRKFLGDYLIASYLNAVQESGFDDGYIKEIEVCLLLFLRRYIHIWLILQRLWSILLSWKQRAVLLKTLDCFWRDHLVNMNKLSSAVTTEILLYLFSLKLSDTHVKTSMSTGECQKFCA